MRKITAIIPAFEAPLTPTMTVKRVFPGRNTIKHVDPFVFLDHFGPAYHQAGASAFEEGTGEHPHRGFITFTYLFDGNMEHKDSRGHHGIVASGGAQWMKAASGIVHDEKPSKAFLEKGGIIHGLQLWINLPAKHKSDTPQYQALPNEAVQERILPDGTVVRVLIGVLDTLQSDIPTLSPMAVYHVRIAPQSSVELPVTNGWNLFVYVPTGAVVADEQQVKAGEMALFEQAGDQIELHNPSDTVQDMMFFAGQPIGEPIITSGPFVMDTLAGVQQAYDDFYIGAYGTI